MPSSCPQSLLAAAGVSAAIPSTRIVPKQGGLVSSIGTFTYITIYHNTQNDDYEMYSVSKKHDPSYTFK